VSTSTLPHRETIAKVLKSLETETTALFEHLDLGFLWEFPVFAPDPRGRKRVFEPPELFRGLLHCFYNNIYAPKAMEQELANDDIWPVCGFDRPPSRRTIGRFIDDLSGVVKEVFSRILRQVLVRVELGTCFRIDGTDVRAPRPDEDASWNYDSTADECYYGYGCCLVTTDNNIPVAAEFTPEKSVDKETARRITQDALAVKKPITFVGDAEFDMLAWHDDLLEAGVVPVAPYNPRNTNDPPDIEYRLQKRIKEHSDTVRVWEKQLNETYNNRSQIETTIGVCKDLGLGSPEIRGRERVRTHVFVALCLRLVVVIANHERGGDIASPVVEL
jgi:hypothetical protein